MHGRFAEVFIRLSYAVVYGVFDVFPGKRDVLPDFQEYDGKPRILTYRRVCIPRDFGVFGQDFQRETFEFVCAFCRFQTAIYLFVKVRSDVFKNFPDRVFDFYRVDYHTSPFYRYSIT